MAKYGPVPKRDDQRIRRNAEYKDIEKVTAIGSVPVPELNLEGLVHPLVKDLYRSLAESAQSRYFEPSDWQYARLVMYTLNDWLLTRNKEGYLIPMTAMKLQAISGALSDLLVTEADRRRIRLEIERNPTTGEGGQVLNVSDLIRQRLAQ